MKPGRELDALVAEKVMGWQRKTVTVARNMGKNALGFDRNFSWQIEALVFGDSIHAFDEFHQPYNASGLPKYSTDIAAAWMVVEKMQSYNPFWAESGKEAFMSFFFSPAWGNDGASWMVNFGDETTMEFGKTMPHAICLAALKAVGAI